MAAEKGSSLLYILAPIGVLAVLLIATYFLYQTYIVENQQQPIACTQDAMQCPDGSYVGRTGPNCEFVCPAPNQAGQEVYSNTQYGFQLTLPNSWKGYSTIMQQWQGWYVSGSSTPLYGPQIFIRNPKWTQSQPYQDVPIMVFTKSQWQLVTTGKLAVSAAPIGPEKLGENQNFIFALPPRWYGFADAQGQDEAVAISKTFKAF